MIAECNSYWQNITCTGRIWLILAEHDLYWQNLTSIGRISLPLAEHDLIRLIVTLAGRIWLILAEYDFHWQNMRLFIVRALLVLPSVPTDCTVSIPGLNLPFLQILPTAAFLFFTGTDGTDSPDCLPILLSISVFFSLLFLFSTVSCFRAID